LRFESLVAALIALGVMTHQKCAIARSVIKEPGAHPHYAFELEPHLVLDWAGVPGPHDDGLGVGLRASVPLFHNGPIDRINNNMAITFGFDFTRATHACAPPRTVYWGDCRIDSYFLPVALQWNFFLTDIISVFGEPGLALVNYRWNTWDRCWAPGYCSADGHDTHLTPVFWGGARFLFSDTVGVAVRLGFPSVTAGITFLL